MFLRQTSNGGPVTHHCRLGALHQTPSAPMRATWRFFGRHQTGVPLPISVEQAHAENYACADKSNLVFLWQTIIRVFFKHEKHIASHSNYNSNHPVIIAFLTFRDRSSPRHHLSPAHLWQDIFATAFPLSTLPHSPFAHSTHRKKCIFAGGTPDPFLSPLALLARG